MRMGLFLLFCLVVGGTAGALTPVERLDCAYIAGMRVDDDELRVLWYSAPCGLIPEDVVLSVAERNPDDCAVILAGGVGPVPYLEGEKCRPVSNGDGP